jgi:hypothetical protein
MALSGVEFLGEMSGLLHSRARLPLIPLAPFSHKGRRGILGVLMPETKDGTQGLPQKTHPCKLHGPGARASRPRAYRGVTHRRSEGIVPSVAPQRRDLTDREFSGVSWTRTLRVGYQEAYRDRFLGSSYVSSSVLVIRTPKLPLLPLWEKGAGG